MPIGATWSVKVPVQSGFTAYVPVIVTLSVLPFWLNVAVAVVPPYPSNVCVPTWAIGPARVDGAVRNPLDMNPKVPVRVALEHPLSWAFAVGNMHSASAVTAAIVKVLVMVLRFMIISFAF
jgi:hypothetical protein